MRYPSFVGDPYQNHLSLELAPSLSKLLAAISFTVNIPLYAVPILVRLMLNLLYHLLLKTQALKA